MLSDLYIYFSGPFQINITYIDDMLIYLVVAERKDS